MIMDPGMGGLETYGEILEVHPCQQAIIASGYSHSACIQKAMALGAGAYLKKPYNLKIFGMAAKKELAV
jgi:two-component system cell cycle sensor histidine kinase/response regulator CckA